MKKSLLRVIIFALCGVFAHNNSVIAVNPCQLTINAQNNDQSQAIQVSLTSNMRAQLFMMGVRPKTNGSGSLCPMLQASDYPINLQVKVAGANPLAVLIQNGSVPMESKLVITYLGSAFGGTMTAVLNGKTILTGKLPQP